MKRNDQIILVAFIITVALVGLAQTVFNGNNSNAIIVAMMVAASAVLYNVVRLYSLSRVLARK